MADPVKDAVQASEATHAHTHVVSIKALAGTWGLLIGLTWITVTAAGINLGNANIFVALFIAVIKSSFVVLYFMHLRYDKPFNAVIFTTAALFVALFIGLALMDTKGYRSDLIPGYAPQIDKSGSETH